MKKKRVISSIANEEYIKLKAESKKKGLSLSALICTIITERYTEPEVK